ncbi:MAG: hypothetical protein Q4B73_08490 [Lachnospiraceae bacterium]|nr:hypothetical protein [Lachnospiraceae bacterium]
MRESRTPENEKFEKFFSIVRKEADRNDAVFFINCGEGNEVETDTMECEDLSGWLIPKSVADEFEPEFLADDVSEKWNDFYVFEFWEKSGDEILVRFEQF